MGMGMVMVMVMVTGHGGRHEGSTARTDLVPRKDCVLIGGAVVRW